MNLWPGGCIGAIAVRLVTGGGRISTSGLVAASDSGVHVHCGYIKFVGTAKCEDPSCGHIVITRPNPKAFAGLSIDFEQPGCPIRHRGPIRGVPVFSVKGHSIACRTGQAEVLCESTL